DPHDIVDHRRAEDGAPLLGSQALQLDQRLRRDADARRRQDGPHEEPLPPPVTEQARRRGAAGERQDDSAQGGPEGDLADAPHLLQVGLHPGDEHQQDDADLRQHLHDRRQVLRPGLRRGAEHAPAQDVQETRPQEEPREDLAEHRRLAQARAEMAGPLRDQGDQSEEEQDLKHGIHGLASPGPAWPPVEGDRRGWNCIRRLVLRSRRMARALLLALLLVIPWSVFASSPDDPLPIRSQLPFKLLFLEPAPAAAGIEGDSEARVSLHATYENTLVASDALMNEFERNGMAVYNGRVTLPILTSI